MSKCTFGFLPNTISFGLQIANLKLLNAIYASMANSKYSSYILPKAVRFLVNTVDNDVMSCSACNN